MSSDCEESKGDARVEALRKALSTRQWVQSKPTAPSMAVGVVYKGQIVLEEATKNDSPLSTLFAVASISKLMLSVLALQCVEKNELKSLDVDINTCLPTSCNLNPPPFVTTTKTTTTTQANNTTQPTPTEQPTIKPRIITFRMLLTHSSGLDDDESALDKYRVVGKDYPTPLSEYVSERLNQKGLWRTEDPPNYHYSNLGMTILATALEYITGHPLSWLAQHRIFIPLQMTRSSFLLSEALAFPDSRVASPYNGREELRHSSVAEWPAAALRSTAHDLCLFLAHFSGPSPPTILSSASVSQMLPKDFCQGLAWWGRDAAYGVPSGGVWSHGGFMVGVRSHIYLWPEVELGLVFMQNGAASYRAIIQGVVECISKDLGLKAALPIYLDC